MAGRGETRRARRAAADPAVAALIDDIEELDTSPAADTDVERLDWRESMPITAARTAGMRRFGSPSTSRAC